MQKERPVPEMRSGCFFVSFFLDQLSPDKRNDVFRGWGWVGGCDGVIVKASDGQSVRRVNASGDWSKRPM